VPPATCEIHNLPIGGGFSWHPYTDYIHIATLIAKQVLNRSVKMMCAREVDMAHGKYHPVTRCVDVHWISTASTSHCGAAAVNGCTRSSPWRRRWAESRRSCQPRATSAGSAGHRPDNR
jgi:hypothetical protein